MQTLRLRRKEMGLTLTELADRIGITAGQLSRIERDGPTSIKTAFAIERATGVKIGILADASTRDVRAVARVLGEAA